MEPRQRALITDARITAAVVAVAGIAVYFAQTNGRDVADGPAWAGVYIAGAAAAVLIATFIYVRVVAGGLSQPEVRLLVATLVATVAVGIAFGVAHESGKPSEQQKLVNELCKSGSVVVDCD